MYIRASLCNGIPIVMERMEGIRSVSIGIWVKAGSRHEPENLRGISHFLEHMFFRGTAKRTSQEIAIEIDSLGGELNAFTTKEFTVFYARVLDDYACVAIDILTDMLTHSLFHESDIEKEKAIVTDEIKGIEDTPDEYIYDIYDETIWGSTGLGQNILGSVDVISTFSREHLLSYIEHAYCSDNIVISAAGNFDPQKIIDHFNASICLLQKKDRKYPINLKTEFKNQLRIHYKELSEVHICLGFKSLSMAHEKRYPLYLLNAIAGSGMSSRLFQEIREKRGLAYSIYSFLSSYHDTGIFGVYVGTRQERVVNVLELILKEVFQMRHSITDEELTRAKEQLKGNMLLAMESSIHCMNNIAKQEIYMDRYYPVAEVIEAIENVSLKDIVDVTDTIIKEDCFGLTILGPFRQGASQLLEMLQLSKLNHQNY